MGTLMAEEGAWEPLFVLWVFKRQQEKGCTEEETVDFIVC